MSGPSCQTKSRYKANPKVKVTNQCAKIKLQTGKTAIFFLSLSEENRIWSLMDQKSVLSNSILVQLSDFWGVELLDLQSLQDKFIGYIKASTYIIRASHS